MNSTVVFSSAGYERQRKQSREALKMTCYGGHVFSQGLLIDLNFDDVKSGRASYASLKGDVTDTDKRTEIYQVLRIVWKSKTPSGHKHSSVDQLDSNKGYHSIFDTVGGHSLHQNGQYHFEIQDGSVRWFHRNESEAQIFSVETDPIIPATVWNHIVGTYTAHTGIAKVFVNGRLKAEAAGKECGGFFYSPTGIFRITRMAEKLQRENLLYVARLRFDPSEKIALSFKSFSLDQNGTCDKAKLVVKDGSSKNANALGVYCGVKRPPGITSSGNHLWLQFTSTEGAEGKGFSLVL
ncbi:hypothetical protein OS493_025337 [Desmophyllum pertusum]|uniref:CUB domain-containing protein n=1 Tax=Desmophyllum pertusum TaxID=174260 RepID=A0A9W9ZAP9_9CNID|nr:hypothetical protein OS493_025337 [Desmophyllum pertusum]